jgi:nucleotide-binding universal stress UspA family protein
MLPIKKILCPTDFSEPSLAALKTAYELAKHFNANLQVLHVIPFITPLPGDMLMAPTLYYPSDKERLEEAQHQVTKLVADHISADVHAVPTVKIGHAAHEIVCAADKDNTDVIVIGTQGLTGWRHFAFGSVAEEVVRKAHRPVLTVHSGPVPPREESIPAAESATANV